MRLVIMVMVTKVKVGLKPGRCFTAFPSLLPRTVISQTKRPVFQIPSLGTWWDPAPHQAAGPGPRPPLSPTLTPLHPSTPHPGCQAALRRPCSVGPCSSLTVLIRGGGSNT